MSQVNEFDKVTLSTIAGGAVEELFQVKLQELLANIQDVNAPASAKRTISIDLIFQADEDRRQVVTGIKVGSKLVSDRLAATVVYTGDRKVDGKFVAVESNRKQLRLTDADVSESAAEAPAQA